MTLPFTLLVRNYSLGWSELRLMNNKVYQVLEGTEETRRMSTDPARWPVNTSVISLPQQALKHPVNTVGKICETHHSTYVMFNKGYQSHKFVITLFLTVQLEHIHNLNGIDILPTPQLS